MGSDVTTQSPLRGAVVDEGRTPKEVAGNGAKVIKGRGGSNDDGEGEDEGEHRD